MGDDAKHLFILYYAARRSLCKTIHRTPFATKPQFLTMKGTLAPSDNILEMPTCRYDGMIREAVPVTDLTRAFDTYARAGHFKNLIIFFFYQILWCITHFQIDRSSRLRQSHSSSLRDPLHRLLTRFHGIGQNHPAHLCSGLEIARKLQVKLHHRLAKRREDHGR